MDDIYKNPEIDNLIPKADDYEEDYREQIPQFDLYKLNGAKNVNISDDTGFITWNSPKGQRLIMKLPEKLSFEEESDYHKFLLDIADMLKKEKEKEYGEPEISFNNLANLWTMFIRQNKNPFMKPLTESDVAFMLFLLKVTRLIHDRKLDSIMDAIGYLTLLNHLTGGQKEEKKRLMIRGYTNRIFANRNAEADTVSSGQSGADVQSGNDRDVD